MKDSLFNNMHRATAHRNTAARNLNTWLRIKDNPADQWRSPQVVERKVAEARAELLAAEQAAITAALRLVEAAEIVRVFGDEPRLMMDLLSERRAA